MPGTATLVPGMKVGVPRVSSPLVNTYRHASVRIDPRLACPAKAKGVVKVELDEFKNAMRRVGVTQVRCPLCGQDAWTGTAAGVEETESPSARVS